MKTRIVVLPLACVLVLPMVALAQAKGRGPEMTRWWDRPVVRDLGLSDEQDKRVRAIVRDSRDRLIQLRGAVDSAEAALSDEMRKDKVDVQKAEAAIERVIAARSELMRAITQMSLKLRLILTPAQWHELEKREAEPPPPQQEPPKRKRGQGDGQRPPPPPPDKDGQDSSESSPSIQ
jgi:Spy/CpxP family protein refolding chaperone